MPKFQINDKAMIMYSSNIKDVYKTGTVIAIDGAYITLALGDNILCCQNDHWSIQHQTQSVHHQDHLLNETTPNNNQESTT